MLCTTFYRNLQNPMIFCKVYSCPEMKMISQGHDNPWKNGLLDKPYYCALWLRFDFHARVFQGICGILSLESTSASSWKNIHAVFKHAPEWPWPFTSELVSFKIYTFNIWQVMLLPILPSLADHSKYIDINIPYSVVEQLNTSCIVSILSGCCCFEAGRWKLP